MHCMDLLSCSVTGKTINPILLKTLLRFLVEDAGHLLVRLRCSTPSPFQSLKRGSDYIWYS